jgi:catechol 2,3-dioxygenase-like lactoylglutathione lyase family enzyme
MSLIQEIHYFRIPVNNLEESVQWYSDCLGFILRHKNKELAVFELKAGPLLTLVKADSNSRGHFYKGGEPEFSVGFTSPDINQLRQKLIDYGVSVDEMKEDNGHYYFHFFDPSGNKLQVHW